MTVLAPSSVLSVGDVQLCRDTRRLETGRGSIVLRRHQFALLERLMRSPDVLISRTSLISVIYPDPDEEPTYAETGLRGNIRKLRGLLDCLSANVVIRNEIDEGYLITVRRR